MTGMTALAHTCSHALTEHAWSYCLGTHTCRPIQAFLYNMVPPPPPPWHTHTSFLAQAPPRWAPTPGPMQAFLFNMASPLGTHTHTHTHTHAHTPMQSRAHIQHSPTNGLISSIQDPLTEHRDTSWNANTEKNRCEITVTSFFLRNETHRKTTIYGTLL